MKYDLENERVEKAIEDLRSEPAPFGGRQRTLEAMIRPQRRLRLVPALAAGVAASLLTLVFWPQQKALAWSQVVKSTLSTERIHVVGFHLSRKTQWERTSEEWTDGRKHAVRSRIDGGGDDSAAVMDMRFDGKRCYWLFWTGYGAVMDSPRGAPRWPQYERYTIEALLSEPRLKLDKTPKDVEIDGVKALEYDAAEYESDGPISTTIGTPMKFFVEKEGGRVIRTESFGIGNKMVDYSTIDYPASIDPQHFAPPLNGPAVFDLNRDANLLKKSMANGVPFGKGNVLRTVVQSPDGNVAILWTGTPANGDGFPHPTIVGRTTKSVSAPYQLTTTHWKMSSIPQYRFNGQVLWGLILHLDKPVDGKVTLQLPILVPDSSMPIRDTTGRVREHRSKQVGTATIRDYPVIRTIPFTVMEQVKGLK